jgi:BirA family biotin operon repressor/biotin-[acetyl-CoA-carboxylase] ligase
MDELPPPAEEWTLPTRHLGRRVLVFDQLDSSNSRALALAHDPAHHGLVLLARAQTAGRGQYGRTWQAAPGSSVLLSVLLFPPAPLCRPALITAWAAVAVSETIYQACGLQARIKWPNDLLLSGKKVCGILTEQRAGAAQAAVVVGIGLNIGQRQDFFAANELVEACSLFTASGKMLEVDAVARALLQRLDDEYDRLSRGDLSALEDLWRARLGLVGQRVGAETARERLGGRVLDVRLDGVLLQTDDGRTVSLPPESIRRLQ